MRILSGVVAACLAAGVSSVASANVVAESGSNDSFATAQSLDGQFSLGSDANVANATTIPFVSVISAPGDPTYDFYSFTVGAADSAGIFDIDFGMPDFDPYLNLFDSAGIQLFANDDAGLDTGSVHPWDSFFGYTFANAGLYYLRVGSCCVSPGTGDYQLNVSLQSPGAPAVPEPSTWAMMLLGFGAAGYAMRRRAPRKLMQIA